MLRNPSDVLPTHSRPIPKALHRKLEAIDKEVVLLHLKWTYLMQLFGRQEHLEVINATAPAIFSAIEDAMFSDILLSLMRLVDPPHSNNQSNLSLLSLAVDISDESVREKFEQLESQVSAKTRDIKIWRNKKLAHNDLLRILKEIAPIPPIQISELTSALKLVREALNLLHRYFFDTTVLYDHCVTEKDGYQLLFYLNYGLECWKEDSKEKKFKRAEKWWKSCPRKLDWS